jgi:hypothetical protein
MKIDDNGTIRDMNEEELATLEAIKQSIKDQEKAAANKAKAKELVLEKLGLTSEEVVALLS